MGSEEDGISDEYLKLCDYKVGIPMKGNIGSLNVSVSAGVVLYEAVRQKTMTFNELGFEPQLQEGLDLMGFEKPTPIQEQAIPSILNNKDLIACAQTGTGKTAAFCAANS